MDLIDALMLALMLAAAVSGGYLFYSDCHDDGGDDK